MNNNTTIRKILLEAITASTEYWADSLSPENVIEQKKKTKDNTLQMMRSIQVVQIADWNEAIRDFAGSFLYKKTPTTFYRIFLTYMGTPVGIDIRISNHPADKDENWSLTEINGLANKRLSIYFRGDTALSEKECEDGVPLFEQGFHYKHLKDVDVINDIRNSIIGFMKCGEFAEVSQPFIESDSDVAERIR